MDLILCLVAIHLTLMCGFRSFIGQEHRLYLICHFQKCVRLIHIGIQLPKIDFVHYVPPFRFTGSVDR